MPSLNLTGVPETMLWTLHNRASEAARPDAVLRDAEAVRVYRAIDYDFERSFGPPDGSHALRSLVFDRALRPWLSAHPGGTVVELACGLETQFSRVDDGRVRWVCVDVPAAIDVRERYLPPSPRCRHIARSALDLAWLDEVDPSEGVFVTAQGLLMYFDPTAVERLLSGIAARLPGVTLMFDTIPPWFSRKTLAGYQRTPHYRTPPMPWGVTRRALPKLLDRWMPSVVSVDLIPYGYLRGVAGLVLPLATRTPLVRELLPCVVRVRTAPRSV